MAHDHAHHHQPVVLTNVNTAFIVGISLNFLFVIVEAVAGLITNSLSLLSDAGHNLADVGTLALSLLAFRLVKVKSNAHYTYGYRKTSILAALFNSVLLLISIGAIVYESIQRFLNPTVISGTTISIVAGIGIVINGVTALLFLRDKDQDINIKSAYLHLMADAVVSLGIVIGGVIIIYTKWYWLDSALSILIAIVILFSTWKLLKDSLRLSIDGVPDDINMDDVKSAALKINGIKDFHHIHIWAISSTENALTGHIVLQQTVSIETEQQLKTQLKHELLHLNIHHVTLETERESNVCKIPDC